MNGRFAVRRILVATEAGTGAPEALEAAAELAHRLDAELEVLVVENVDLLRAGGLPFARQVTVAGRGWEAFEVPVIEQEMRAFSTRARRLLEDAAARRRLVWSMRVARGSMARELAAASEAADLIVVEAQSRPLFTHLRLSSAARRAIAELLRPVYLVPPRAAPLRHVMVLYDDRPGTERVLAAAAAFARTMAIDLAVLIHADGEARRRELEAGARRVVSGEGIEAVFRPLADAGARLLCRLARDVPGTLLVMGAEGFFGRDEAERMLFDRLDCPLLVVR